MIKKNIKKSFLKKRVFTRPSLVKIFFKWKHEPVKVLKYSNYMKIIFTGTRRWKFKNKKTVKNNSFLSKVITSSNCRDCTCNKWTIMSCMRSQWMKKTKVKKSKNLIWRFSSETFFLLQILSLLFNFFCYQDDAVLLKIACNYRFNSYEFYVCEVCKNTIYATWLLVNSVNYASWDDVNWASKVLLDTEVITWWLIF